MLNELKISGYKCLMDINLICKNLNVLVGANASGKSSVLQSLLLLKQSINQSNEIPSFSSFRPALRGRNCPRCITSIVGACNINFLDTDDEGLFGNSISVWTEKSWKALEARILTLLDLSKLPLELVRDASFSY